MTSRANTYRLLNVRKTYGDSWVLELPQLEILSGEILCLLGPTGAGKSTLLRLLAAVESVSSGEIRFHDETWNANVALTLRRRVAMVHQRPMLLTDTVWRNVEYGLRIRGVADRDRRVAAVLDQLGLSDLGRRSAQTLSGGQTHLVGLARALVLDPDVLLLDEPTAHLDPALVAVVEQAVRQTHAARQLTVVWATHNLFQARRMAERVALLLRGQLVEVASARKFFDAPSDPRTADFVLGKMVY